MQNAIVRASTTALPKIQDRLNPTEADRIDDLSFLPDRYGMIVTGGCLAPIIPDGATVLVDKTAPYRDGDLVVIYRKREATPDGRFQGLIKRLRLAPPSWVTSFPFEDHPESEIVALIVAETLNPPQRLNYRCRDLLGIHKCLGLMPAEIRTVRSPLPDACRRPALQLAKGGAQ